MRLRGVKLARRVADRLGLRRAVVVQLGQDGKALRPARMLEHFHADSLEPGRTRWEWPGHLDASARPWLGALQKLYEHPLSYPTSISPQAGLLLHALTLNLRPRACVETGSNIGVSALWMAGALHELGSGTLTCFDDFKPIVAHGAPRVSGEERRAILEDAIRGARLGNRVDIVAGDSAANLERRCASGEKVQLAFLDGDHEFDGVLRDFLAVEPMLETGGIVVLHDTFPWVCGWEGPRRLLNTLHEYATGTYQTVDLYLGPVNYGMAVVRRVG